MGTLTNELLYKLNLPLMGMNKKIKVFVIEPNSTYETEYVFKDKDGYLQFYSKVEELIKNPKIVSDDKKNITPGTKNASTGQTAYLWYRGEKFAYPLASRDTTARTEDENTILIQAVEHGKLIERGKWQKTDLGIDKTRQMLLIMIAVEIGIAVGVWQILGAV